MEYEILINQHLHWKNLVESIFNEEDSAIINPSRIVKHNECDLGKWIESCDSSVLLANSTFQQLDKVHKGFHYCTGKILLDFQSGRIEDAKKFIPEYNELSNELVYLIHKIEKEIPDS